MSSMESYSCYNCFIASLVVMKSGAVATLQQLEPYNIRTALFLLYW